MIEAVRGLLPVEASPRPFQATRRFTHRIGLKLIAGPSATSLFTWTYVVGTPPAGARREAPAAVREASDGRLV